MNTLRVRQPPPYLHPTWGLSTRARTGIDCGRWREFPRPLALRVRRFYEYYYRRVPAFDEAQILEEMTPQLRLEATSFLLQKSVGAMPLFARAAPEFQMHVYPRLRPHAVSMGDVIYKRGDISRHLYFLIKGEVNVRRTAPPLPTVWPAAREQQGVCARVCLGEGSLEIPTPLEPTAV